jgi:hypothetical protein
MQFSDGYYNMNPFAALLLANMAGGTPAVAHELCKRTEASGVRANANSAAR